MSECESKKRKSLFLIVLFYGIIGALLLLFLFLPKTKVSSEERRVLESTPRLSVQTVLDGAFEKSAERYISDHFPFRKRWLTVDAHFRLLSGQNGANGIYLGKNGFLVNAPLTEDWEQLRANLSAIRTFADSVETPVSVMIVPSAGVILNDILPKNHADYPDKRIFKESLLELEASIKWVDLLKPFLESATREKLYYKTDHHWTSEGAYTAYTVYAKSQGFTQVSRENFDVTVFDGFYGTTYAKSCLWEMKPDQIEIWSFPEPVEIEIRNDNQPQSSRHTSMFFENQLSGPDPYSVFLDGNHSLVKIINKNVPSGTLLVVKDSFGNCMIPFLTNHYRQIDVIDLRYFRKQTASELMAEDQVDQVLFLYGINELVNDRNWIWLK